jgi:hypothetical protein
MISSAEPVPLFEVENPRSIVLYQRCSSPDTTEVNPVPLGLRL